MADIGVNHCYMDESGDGLMINRLADECYLPANSILLANLKKYSGKFRLSFSISGSLIELLQIHRPDVIESFKQLIHTGYVELLGETYYNSLSFLHSKNEFERQVRNHSQLIRRVFGVKPRVFRNTELIYNNNLALHMIELGFKGVLCEGIERILNGRTPNQMYTAPHTGEFALFLRNSALSDDVAFRFGNNNWSEYPLTAGKFAEWLHRHPRHNEMFNLFLDYETFGFYKKEETGIFDFLNELPEAVLANEYFEFSTPSKAIESHYPRDVYDIPCTISWEDKSRACCVWCENARQNNTLKKIYSLENFIRHSSYESMIESWGRLQAAEYFFYMADHNIHRSFLDRIDPEDAYEYYRNIVADLEIRFIKEQVKKNRLDFIPLSHNVY